ncbi:phage integrase family protein [Paucimonas lemoignei]|uniref:Phage integrase family protein n=1 Tax=Paucimonas lemoignei TaxID=29443 RepID=A0A4R3HUH3_PAULE|nr:tyrosine-type recombinase/integrase [Paucimonas lemoignei]TCS35821.1 phage integrase family protein [Paucimonas lemoignei]
MQRYLTPQEQQQLLGAAAKSADIYDRRDHAWIRALLHSGLRIQEFSRITLGDAMAALREKYLFIPKENRKGKGQDHRVFVTAALRAALEDLAKIHFEIVGEEKSNLSHALVLSREHGGYGKPMSVRSYELRLKHWAKVAGLRADVSPHWLRHSRAMNIMRSSEAKDPRGITQAALGHTSIASTGVYTKATREEIEEALNQVDAPAGKRVTLSQLRKQFERRAS